MKCISKNAKEGSEVTKVARSSELVRFKVRNYRLTRKLMSLQKVHAINLNTSEVMYVLFLGSQKM